MSFWCAGVHCRTSAPKAHTVSDKPKRHDLLAFAGCGQRLNADVYADFGFRLFERLLAVLDNIDAKAQFFGDGGEGEGIMLDGIVQN